MLTTGAFASITNVWLPPVAHVCGNMNSFCTGIMGNPINNTVLMNTNNINFNNFDVIGAIWWPAGSAATTPAMTGNVVHVNASGLTNIGDIIGASSGPTLALSRSANWNTVNITAAANNIYNGMIIGGESVRGASNNTVNIAAGTFNNLIVGGLIFGDGNSSSSANNNTVNITGGTSFASVNGGLSNTGSSSGNTVNISAGTFSGNIFGGQVTGMHVQAASNNTINITGGTSFQEVNGGFSNVGSSSGNTVNISGGTSFTQVAGGNGNGVTSNNTVNITAGDSFGIVVGGMSRGVAAATNSNVIRIDTGGIFNDQVLAGWASNTGGGTANAGSNRIYISDGTFLGDVRAGTSSGMWGATNDNFIQINGGNFEQVIAGTSVNGTSSNNTIIINGGTFSNNIVGGFTTGTGNVMNNTITIAGAADLTAATLIGGQSNGGGTSANNTLNIETNNVSVVTASGFQNFNFLVYGYPNNALLTATGAVIDMAGANVDVTMAGRSSALAVGDRIELVNNMTGAPVAAGGPLRGGLTMLYDWDVDVVGANLGAVITGKSLNPNTKAFSQSRIAALGMINAGADLVTRDGMASAVDAAKGDGFGVFSSVSYGSMSYDTGSSVDMDNISFIMGAAKGFGSVMAGAFIEAGMGNYTSHNNISGANIQGNGDNSYFGAGLMSRWSATDNIYLEGSVRGGIAQASFDSANLGAGAEFDKSSAYYGGHIGAGYKRGFGRIELEGYTQYILAVQSGTGVTLGTNEEIVFGDAMSSRAVAGVRAKMDSVFIGYSYEHEFAGSADAQISGMAVDAPTIAGGTQIVEGGWGRNFGAFGVNTVLRYHFGVRTGISANANIGYRF